MSSADSKPASNLLQSFVSRVGRSNLYLTVLAVVLLASFAYPTQNVSQYPESMEVLNLDHDENSYLDVTAALKDLLTLVNQSGPRFKTDENGEENATALDNKLKASHEEKHFKNGRQEVLPPVGPEQLEEQSGATFLTALISTLLVASTLITYFN